MGKTHKTASKAYKSRQRSFHIMLLAPCVVLFIFNYLPIFGLVMAFQNFQPGLGFLKSEWVGLKNFETLMKLPNFLPALRNTLVIAVGKIIGNLIIPIIFALMLNEVRNKWFKKTAQTITYLPYFLSWIVLSGIFINFLSQGSTQSDTGFLNTVLMNLGLTRTPIDFLGDKNLFPWTMIFTDVWKNFGYNAIVYLAALTGIDPSLYEAAAIDGAGRWKQTIHVTLPGIAPIIVLMTVLSIGNILNAGFDQIFNMYSASVYATGDIIDTLVYRLGMVNQQYSLSAAVGFFKSLVSGILIIVSYKLAEKFAGYQVF
ncbi:MAG: ABC transporter permease subunit [Eubacteriales bacterium]|nr:ABC transporter permease subunit [Eubacteriales bacterium]